jgi:hypothetical protein
VKLTIFNASPRKGVNNTAKLLEKFIEGFTANPENSVNVYRLNEFVSLDEAVEIFRGSENILLAFPLYSYSVPAGVKAFFEKIGIDIKTRKTDKTQSKRIGFLVQYGFPEAIHARPLEKYLKYVTPMLGCNYLGTIIKGGCDALIKFPEKFFKLTYDGIYNIGNHFGKTGELDEALLKNFSKPEKQGFMLNIILRITAVFINHFYWSAALKKNGVYEKRFDRPLI